jgi:hypothetical protein
VAFSAHATSTHAAVGRVSARTCGQLRQARDGEHRRVAGRGGLRAGLGAEWPFLSDEKREVIRRIGILDETEGEYAYVARPYTFVLHPDLTMHKIYDGWFFVGWPTLEELRQDLREVMSGRSDYHYEAHDTPEAKKIRIDPEDLEGARRALLVRALSPGWRDSFEERLTKAGDIDDTTQRHDET